MQFVAPDIDLIFSTDADTVLDSQALAPQECEP